MSKLLLHSRQLAKSARIYLRNIAVPLLITTQQKCFMSSSGALLSNVKDDFRHIGTEKDTGALQDLLRRVMEIDAQITNTAVVNFKPKTQICTGYCVADALDLHEITSKLSSSSDFHVTNTHSFSNMIHILDQAHGGDVYLFSNGTFVCWGLDQLQQEKILNYCGERSPMIGTTFESMEYIIDEDEVTDIKGDVILLNPHVPSIELSKVAFSFSLGRAAKLASIEKSLEDYLTMIDAILFENEKNLLSTGRPSTTQLLRIRQRMMKGSRDGFLGTSDFHWTRPELQGYVDKISTTFDVQTRIQILNKKMEYAIDATKSLKDLLSTIGVVSI
ncbi:unnamed protein product [Mucor hiemalis]